MTRSNWAWAALAIAPAALCAAPAWAATSTSIVVTSRGETLPRSSIQLFNAETGAQVRMEDEDDDRVAALFLLDRGRYRVVVNGETLQEISVSGTGSQTFTIEAPPRLAAPSRPAQGLTPADERRIADAMTREDQIFAEWDEKTRLLVNAGVGNLEVSNEAGIGFQRPSGGPEVFAARNPDTVRMHILGVTLFPLAYREWLISGSLLHGRGDAERNGEIQGGGSIDVGWAYSDRSPANSTGLFLGNRTAVWTTRSDAELLNLKFKMVRMASGPATWFIFADYLNSRRDYDGDIQVEAFGDIFSQTRDQRVSDDLFGGGFGFQYFDMIDNRVGVGGWSSAGLFHRRTSLRTAERNVCPACSLGSGGSWGPNTTVTGNERDFVVAIDESDEGLTWALAAGVFFGIPLTERVMLGAGADVAYIDEVGSVINPYSGNQLLDGETTRLGSADALSYNFRLGLSLTF